MNAIPKRVRPGDELTAVMWNQLIDYLEQSQLSIAQNGGLALQSGPKGRILSIPFQSWWFLAVANGNISARSGTTLGTGSVFLVSVNNGVASVSTVSYPVLYASSKTMTSGHGIDDSMYCFVQEYPSGVLLVSPFDCS